jgi:hypothetical protein
MDQFALEPRRDRFQFKGRGAWCDDRDFVMGGGDRAVLPAIEGDGDLGVADADRLRDPNRAM